jgi:hypothetical protein
MNRTARKVAMSAAAGAVALALTSPAAVADDGDGYEGESDGYSEEYDEQQSDDSEDGDEDDSDDSDDEYESDDDSDEGHEDGDEHDEYDDDSDGREYDAYRERHHEDHDEEPRSYSAYRGHGDGDSRHDDRHEKLGGQATGDAEDGEDGEERESETETETESFSDQQTAILTHLSRADAFLADLGERISAADLDPGLKNALLSLIDERRNHLAGLVAQVRTATSWEDLNSLRDDAYGEMTEPTT